MGKPAQVGEIREWGGERYRKVAPDRWERVGESGTSTSAVEEAEFTRPGQAAPGRIRQALQSVGSGVRSAVQTVRERGVVGAAKQAARQTLEAVKTTTDKLSAPLEQAGYSPRVAKAIAAVAATVAVSPASFSLLLGAIGAIPMGIAAAIPGAGEAGALIGGAIAVRDPLGAGRRLAAKIRERRQQERQRTEEVAELKRKYAGQFADLLDELAGLVAERLAKREVP